MEYFGDKLHRAIQEINPNAEYRITEQDLNNIEWLNGTAPISVSDIETKMSELPTLEEIAEQRETEIANMEAEKTAEDNARAEKENLKASAKAKLIAGEALTEEEANTIVI